MFSAIYQGRETTIDEEWQKYDGDKGVLYKLGKKGVYTCPYCGNKLFIRAGEKYDRHFAHLSGKSCFEANIQEKQMEKYKRQKKREAPSFSAMLSYILEELNAQAKIHQEVSVQRGVNAKAQEQWPYYPDIILKIQNREIAISILTNVTPTEDAKIIKIIEKQNKFYKEKGLDIIWFIENREKTINMDERIIHLWASEVELAIDTAEDRKWMDFLKKIRQGQHSIIKVFGYPYSDDMDKIVKSLYYVSIKDEKVVFTVNRFILDKKANPPQGFVLNEGYDIEIGTALSIENQSLKLSDEKTEEQLKNDFSKQYKEKLTEPQTQSLGTIKTAKSKNINEEEAIEILQKIYTSKVTAEEVENLYTYIESNPSFLHNIDKRRFRYAYSRVPISKARRLMTEIDYLF